MSLPTRRTSFVLLSLGMSLVAVQSSHAQDGPRWRAWVGCWSPVVQNSSTSTTPDTPSIVCVTPTPDLDVADLAVIEDGKVVSHDRLDASGRSQAIEAGGCKGSSASHWSNDARRVFLRSTVTCDGRPTETASILAMTTSGEWIDARSVTSGGNTEVRVARYRDAGLPGSVPAEIATLVRDASMSVRGARVAIAAPVGPREIIEASHSSDAALVEAWLLESGQHFSFDGSTISQLADADVPSRVTDAIVNSSREYNADRRVAEGDRVVEHVVTVYDPWAWGYRAPYPVVRYVPVYRPVSIGFSFSLFGFGYVRPSYAYVPFGYYPYSYRPVVYVPYGVGFGSSRNYGRPVRVPVVIRRPEHDNRYEPRGEHGQAERGRGYTQTPRQETRRETESPSRSAQERVHGQPTGSASSSRPAAPRETTTRAPEPSRRGDDRGRSAHARQ